MSAPEGNGDLDSKTKEASRMHLKLDTRRVMVLKSEVKRHDGEPKGGPI